MEKKSKTGWTDIVAGAVGVIALLAAIALIVIYSGRYNVAATEEHYSLTRWAFDTTFRNSVRSHAAGIEAPGITQAMIETGAQHYKETCQTCHGGPGARRAEWAEGMRPRPPYLAKAAAEWKLEEIFWLVKHGAKMTGMPAFGPGHDEQTLWSIAAFVKDLPAMTPERYRQLGSRQAEDQPSEGHHQEGHSERGSE